VTEPDPEELRDAHVRAALGLMAAIERDDLDTANDIAFTWDPLQLQKGLAIVA
jgi:hypothetical protein